MIRFEEFTLANGLRVIVHEDNTVQLAVLNILYDVGSRDEEPNKTGFAHLFEHLMFGGSANIPSYDEPCEDQVGGAGARLLRRHHAEQRRPDRQGPPCGRREGHVHGW